MRIVREYIELNDLNRTARRAADDKIGIVTAGTGYLDTMEALETLGFGTGQGVGDEAVKNASTVRVLKLGVVWPLSPKQIRDFAEGLDTIIVVEEKRAFIEAQIKELLYYCARAADNRWQARPRGARAFRGAR